MQFRLLYEGPLASRRYSDPADKHRIRMCLHPQIKALWQYKPLSDIKHHLRESDPHGGVAILEDVTTYSLLPLSQRGTIWLANLASRSCDNRRRDNCSVKEGTSITV
jgi:hypothetical protein